MNIAVEALIEISHLLGGPVGSYYPAEIKVDIYEERVQAAARIARRVIMLGSHTTAIPLGPVGGDQ
jgi:hypothetical protein